ncbi:MAG TPA: protein kinase [Blastocatellia bacterium]|nr:protein kinase [Blastocatellia bacterium]
MTPERWEEIDRVFEAALDCAPEKRADFLARQCREDHELRREVESLLEAHNQADSFTARAPVKLIQDVISGSEPDTCAIPQTIIGRTLSHYQIKSLLGKGGMGEVYRAQDLRLDRDVAIKILPPRLASDPDALPRFEREAKAVAALSHPNILAIHDFGYEQGIRYAVMELLEGETLRSRLSRGNLSWKQAAQIAASIADGLSAAHSKGIIHRDLKPENIFLNADGQVKILDFGIARVKQQFAKSPNGPTLPDTTEPGKIIGTIGYMSPEQLRGEAVDAPSDLFSLGCVLYEMVSGKRPFARDTVTETMAAILRDEPTPLASLRVPAEFEKLILRCLEKDPRERLQSAHDLAIELRMLASESQQIRFSLPRNRKGLVWVAAAVFVMLSLAILSVYVLWPRPIDSLAVLPFVNASSDPNTEYLSDGISESLINSLSQLPQLKVIARSSTFKYKGKEPEPQDVAKALGVRAILTGRIANRGNRLLISVELTDARDKTHVWGEQYLRDATDLLAVQTEISREIADKLRLKLSHSEQQQITKRETVNPAAYEFLLKGRYLRNKGGTEDRKKAVEYFQLAIEVDPKYALAYAELGTNYRSLVAASILPPKEYTPKAREAVQKALELDSNLAEGHRALASILRDEWDWPAAEKEYKRALELNPNLAEVHRAYASFLSILGRHDEAIAAAKRSRELDPLSMTSIISLGQRLYFARRYDEAIEALKKALEVDPGYDPAYLYLGYSYTDQGRYPEAIAAFQQAIKYGGETTSVRIYLGYAYAKSGQREQARKILNELLSSNQYVSPGELATLYAGLGDQEQTLATLEKAFAAHDLQLQFLGIDPAFDSLRSDPRFVDLLRRVRLSP